MYAIRSSSLPQKTLLLKHETLMCYLSITACKPIQEFTQNEIMNLTMSAVPQRCPSPKNEDDLNIHNLHFHYYHVTPSLALCALSMIITMSIFPMHNRLIFYY